MTEKKTEAAKPTRASLNASMERLSIRGRQYATVDARVLAFWELYPDGQIITELLSDDGDRCVFSASAIDGGRTLATGHAFEVRTASAVNKTSYVENCETSAVGRALGFLGIGSNGSIASADEVSGAIAQQDAAKHEKAPQKAPDALTEAKQRMWKAIKDWSTAHGFAPEQTLENVKARSDWAETAEFFNGVAAEFEADL